MNRTIHATAVLVLATLGSGALGQPQNHAAKDTAQHKVETLFTIADARSGIAKKVDLAEPGDSPGDVFVFDQPLLNKNSEVIGRNSGFCIRTLPGKFSQCQWTLTLPNGSINVAGQEADSGTSIIPIIGGTEDYLMVSGTLATTPNDNRTYNQILTIYRPLTSALDSIKKEADK
jgi:hypothetical protein